MMISDNKDFWDKFGTLSTFLSSFVIALVGLYFTHSFNERQAAREHAEKQRENRIREVELVQKFIPQLTGSESEKRIAIIAISSLGNTELATQIAALDSGEGSQQALVAIAQRGATEGDRKLAVTALAKLAQENLQTYRGLIPKIRGGSDVGRKALDVALRELEQGAFEEGGQNMGPQIKKYLAATGLKEGLPWSAAFVSWCFSQTSDVPPFRPSASWQGLWEQFKEREWLRDLSSGYRPESGDVIFFRRGTRMGHGGIVMLEEDDVIYLIEGNVNVPGSREGQLALIRPRDLSGSMSFGRVPDIQNTQAE